MNADPIYASPSVWRWTTFLGENGGGVTVHHERDSIVVYRRCRRTDHTDCDWEFLTRDGAWTCVPEAGLIPKSCHLFPMGPDE